MARNKKEAIVKSRGKWIRRIFLIIAGLFILLLIAYFISNPLIKKRIDAQLKMLEPEIKVSYASVHLKLFPLSISLDDLNIEYLPNANQPGHRHSAHFQQASFHGIHLFELLRGKEFIADNMKLNQATLILDRYLLDKHQSLPPGFLSRQDLKFSSISFHRIECVEIKLMIDSEKQHQFEMHADLDLRDAEIKDIKDSMSLNNAHLSSARGNLSDLRLLIPGTLHRLHIKTISFNTEKNTASIKMLEIIPQYGKLQIGKELGFQADYVQASTPEIEIVNLDWSALLKNKIKAGKIILAKTTAYIFRDRRLGRRLENQPLPGDLLNSLPFDLRIDSLLVRPSWITYEEFPAKGEQSGILKIERMRMSVVPFINHPGVHDQQELRSQVHGSIMGSGEVIANISMPLKSKTDYIVQGEFSNLDLTKLNPAAEHLGNFHIESGLLNNLTFEFHFNEEKSSGQVIGEYHGLIIDKLREGGKNNGDKDKVKSFLLQKLVIPKDKDKSLPVARRSGKIDFKRDPTRFISSYLLKSLLSGVKASFRLGFLLPG